MLLLIIFVHIVDSTLPQINVLTRHPSEKDVREVKDLIQNVTDPLQYKTIFDQLLYCPMVPLCNDLSRANTYSSGHGIMSCCSPCACSEKGKETGNQCPNLHIESALSEMTCIRPQYLMYGQTLINAYASYNMIQKCSSDFDDQLVIDKCISDPETYNSLDLSLYVPVTTVTGDVLYKNRHCAICNFVNAEKIVNWEVEMRCDSGITFTEYPNSQLDLLRKIKKEKICNLVFHHVTMAPFECDWGAYTKCNQTGNWIHYDRSIEHACNNYTSVYVGHFKNVFCYMCNKNAFPFMGCVEGDFVKEQPGNFGTFSGLIRYRSEPVIPKKGQCHENEIYDKYKEICRAVFCPRYFIYNSTDCEPYFNQVSAVKYEAIYKVRIQWESSCGAENDGLNPFRNCFLNSAETATATLVKYITSTMPHLAHCSDKTNVYYLISNFEENITTFLIRFQFSILKSHDPEYYAHALTLIPNMNATVSNITIFLISEILSKTEFEMNIGKVRPVILTSSPRLNFECIKDMDVVHVLSDYYCPRIHFDIDKVNISETELLIPNLNVVYNLDSVIRSGNHVTVCLESYMTAATQTYNNKMVSNDEDKIEEILSSICSIVSIVALICTLIIYALFKELRTIPGINNMILAGHLIIANVLYLFGFDATANINLCAALGVLTHYFWLSSFMWMHVCSVHMFRVFFFMRKGPGINQSKRVILFYSLYVISVSVMLICVNIIYFFYGQSSVSGYLGYGGNRCYITNSNMVLYTFAIPVGCISVSNIVLFSLVVFKIEKLPDVQSASGKNRNTFVIYIKLTCLTGLSWIFGFLYQWTLVTALSYVFIILNASQGLFIFLSFCFNSRVKNLCQQKMKRDGHSKSSMTKNTPHTSPTTKKSFINDAASMKPSHQEN